MFAEKCLLLLLQFKSGDIDSGKGNIAIKTQTVIPKRVNPNGLIDSGHNFF